MQAYYLEVRSDYPNRPGAAADDIAAQVVTEAAEHDIEVTRTAARRARGTDLVIVNVTFTADDDASAIAFRNALPSRIRLGSTEADSLRTGTGRSWRRVL